MFLCVHLSLLLLVSCLAVFALMFESQLVLTIRGRDAVMALTFAIALAGVTSYLGASLCPLVALFVRRMHDMGLSGLWLLLVLVPVLGVIFLAVPLFWRGTNGLGASRRHRQGLRRDCEGRKSAWGCRTVDCLATLGLLFDLSIVALCVMMLVGETDGRDIIFGTAFPFQPIWSAELIIFMFGMIWPWPQAVSRKLDWGRDAFCLMTVLLVSLLVHIQVAWLYFGHGMAVPACYHGFAWRLLPVCIAFALAAFPMCIFAIAGLCSNSLVTRQLLAPRGLTAGTYFQSAARRALYCGVFGLLAYEIGLCAWFANVGRSV